MAVPKRINKLSALHPFVKGRALEVLDMCKAAELKVAIFETYRTTERQQYLKDTGKSRTLNSYHRLGLAVDFVFLDDNDNWTWNKPNSDWDHLANIVESCGFESGWRWKGFRDGPHAQMTIPRHTAKTLIEVKHDLLKDKFWDFLTEKFQKTPKYSRFLPKNPPETPKKSTKVVKIPKKPKPIAFEPTISYNDQEPGPLTAIFKFLASLFRSK